MNIFRNRALQGFAAGLCQIAFKQIIVVIVSQLEYSKVTGPIKISVRPQYLASESMPEELMYAFSYTITIENHGDNSVQLKRRHWWVYSGGVLHSEVEGDGVIGEQPVLSPGAKFSYASGTIIKDPSGSMRGSYLFVDEEDVTFEVEIPEFNLINPEMIN